MYKTWKWVGIGKALIKLVKCLLKDNELEAEYNKILVKWAIVPTKDLIANQFILRYI